ncbi:helix-turn-helix domain-containing protein [Halalkalibaculum sp. DA384]|uniref:helix-turn-helix domain-containing protein n=1 Tax=Halalkalibaculum sp. DA384 TaxID=3373606 RepID=UPI0037543C5E
MIQQIRANCDHLEQIVNRIQPEKEWLTTKEFAEKAGLAPKTVSNYVSRGDYRRARKNGKGQWEIHKSELNK